MCIQKNKKLFCSKRSRKYFLKVDLWYVIKDLYKVHLAVKTASQPLTALFSPVKFNIASNMNVLYIVYHYICIFMSKNWFDLLAALVLWGLLVCFVPNLNFQVRRGYWIALLSRRPRSKNAARNVQAQYVKQRRMEQVSVLKQVQSLECIYGLMPKSGLTFSISCLL